MSPSSGLFAAAEVGNTVDNKTYDGEVSALRVELLNLQYDLQSADFPVVLLIAGDDRPAVVGLLRVLHEWMDARYLQNHVMFSSSHEEDTERPVLGRYWRRLPPAGRIGLFLGGWPTSTVRVALEEDWSMPRFDQALDHLARFEKLLADDGALVLKFWLHTPEAVLSERLTAAAADPEKYWDFAQHDWEVFERFDDVYRLIERLIRRTNNITAPWSIIESTDPRYCNLTVGRSIADAVAARLGQPPKVVAPVQPDTASGQSLLEQIDLNAAVDKATYTEGLARLQGRINQLAYQLNEAGIPCVFVFEGVDAAGKGGAIRRLVAALPVQHVRVIPISAPNPAERAHHYLWRFWTRLPRAGKTVIFDRSWYGRVLVERVFSPRGRVASRL